jgi:hypothetical protein
MRAPDTNRRAGRKPRARFRLIRGTSVSIATLTQHRRIRRLLEDLRSLRQQRTDARDFAIVALHVQRDNRAALRMELNRLRQTNASVAGERDVPPAQAKKRRRRNARAI